MPGSAERSLRSLDWINFFMADVTTGIGPFVAIYLTATRHWNPASVGMIIAAQGLASVTAQAPAGWLVDQSTKKKWLVVVGALLVSSGCAAVVLAPNFSTELAAQVLIGVTASIFPPCIAAISLGIVGKSALSARVGRNEGFNHLGNVVFALTAGAAGTWLGQPWIFYSSGVIGFATALTASRIRNSDIDNQAARALDKDEGGQVVGFLVLARDRCLWIFTLSVVLFHFANAAMLPLVGELLAKGKDKQSPLFMSACIILAQFVMIPVAIATGRKSDAWGRKPIFLIGFGVLMARGILYTFSGSAYYLLAVQSLDGVGAGIFGVLWVIIVSDLAKGTGRFNLLQGIIQAALGLGAFMSNSIAGQIVKRDGFNAGFLTLAGVALAGMLLFGIFMPETKDFSREVQI